MIGDSKFEAGDMVCCVSKPYVGFTVGKDYEVIRFLEYTSVSNEIIVKDDHGEAALVDVTHFELTQDAGTFYLIEDHGWKTETAEVFDTLSDAKAYIETFGEEGITYRVAKLEKSFEVTKAIKEV